jgi:acyl-CoA dehydrogenase
MIDLPFFDDRHRQVSSDLAGLADELAPLAERGEAGDVDYAGAEAIRIFAARGLCRRLVPREHGGEGLDLRTLCLIRETVAGVGALADSVFAVQGLGSYPLALGAAPDVARKYFEHVADGRAVAAFALTEPDAGSDVSSIAATARRDGDQYSIDGTKVFISNATIASFFVVFARTSEGTRRAISAFVVDARTPGLTIDPMTVSAPHPIGRLRFNKCRVPASNRIGEEGDGMRVALGTLDFFRTSVGAAACGIAARGLEESRRRATSRKQFGSRLADFQLTQAALADMATELDAARLLVYRSAWLKDQGTERLTRESAMAKLFATEAAQRIVDRAVQIHGGAGVERGSVVERLYREVRALRIYEGTSEIQRLVIARQIIEETHGT